MADAVYLVRDLVFTSKIHEAAAQVGATIAHARDAQALGAAARGARLVIVDLRLPEALDALGALAADGEAAGVATVGFVDHEREDVMVAARARGCGTVLAKGRFASELPALLRAAAAKS